MEDPDQNKLFVGGISWETTRDILNEHFGKYGAVSSSVVAKDRFSGNPRGFAFVSFSESSAVDRALLDSHQILKRTVEVKRAIPRNEQHTRAQTKVNSRTNSTHNEIRTKKIFVGGLSASLTEDEFGSYFAKFGRITDVVVMHDNMTHRPRGFGFITFESEESVEAVMQKNFHELTGKLVEVKRAVPKEESNNSRGSTYNLNSPYKHENYNYSPYNNSRFGYFPVGYGYPYAGINYGLAPIEPRNNWGPVMISVRSGFLPYGSGAAPFYPTYVNPGFVGNEYSGNSMPLTGTNSVDTDSFGSGGGFGAAGANGWSKKVNNDKSYQATNSS